MFEVPVQFFSISPEQVRRTTPLDGMRAIMTALRARLRAPATQPRPAAPVTARASGRGQGPLNPPMDRLLIIPAAGTGIPPRGAHAKAAGAGQRPADARPSAVAVRPCRRRCCSRRAPGRARRGACTLCDESRRTGDRRRSCRSSRPACSTPFCSRVRQSRPAAPRRVWITWCDQVAIHPAHRCRVSPKQTRGDPLLALPTCTGPDPYVHLARDAIRSDRSACCIAAKATSCRRLARVTRAVLAVARRVP